MKLKYIGVLLVLFLLCGCEEDFKVWKEFNENYLETQTAEQKFAQAENGLRYKIVFHGTGATPKSNSLVQIRYKAELSDGTICTSLDTIDVVSNYPAGVRQALMQMPRESIWQLCIPSDLGYGKAGTKNTYGNYIIPPFSTILIKKLELVEVY